MGLKNRVVQALEGRRTHADNASLTNEISFLAQSDARARELDNTLHDLHSSVLFSRWMESPNKLASRKETGFWLNWLGLSGDGVEVGVFKGEFSDLLLRTWRCNSLVSVDPWRHFPATKYVDACNLSQADHDLNFDATVNLLRDYGKRSRVLRATSDAAAAQFASSSLDFVYLDAQHHYEAVREDISLWYPKLKRGGVLGGHDYLDGKLESGLYGVKKAVDDFAASGGYELTLTPERDWPSWFVRIV